MKHNMIRYSVALVLLGLVALTAGGTSAHGSYKEVIIESSAWGVSTGETARVSGLNIALGDGSVRTHASVIMRVQLLDTEGEVIAQSDEIRIEPGKIGFWDAPRELLPAAELTGRIQVRARVFAVFLTIAPFEVRRDKPPLALTLELIDSATGRTMSYNPYITVDYIEKT